MNAKNLVLKFGLVILLVLFALLSIFMGRGVREGIDLRGGHSLVFEIDVGEDDPGDVVVRTIEVLKRRIDPRGLEGIEWLPRGRDRFEVRMPAGGDESRAAHRLYDEAVEALKEGNIQRSDIWQVLEADKAGRPAAITALVGQDEDRVKKLEEVVRAHEAALEAGAKLEKARGAANRKKAQEAHDEALSNFEARVGEALETNINLRRLQVVLSNYVSRAEADAIGNEIEVAKRREQFTTGLGDLERKHAARTGEIEKVVKLYKDWAAIRKYLDDPADLKRLIAKAGVLEYRIAPFAPETGKDFTITADIRNDYVDELQEQGEPASKPGDPYQWFKIHGEPEGYGQLIVAQDESGEFYILLSNQTNDTLLRDGWKLTSAYATTDTRTMTPAVAFDFDVLGATRFARLTSSHLNHAMAVLLDDEVYSAPVIQSVISDSGIITGRFSQDEVRDLVRTLNAGSLPARLNDEPVAERTFSPSIGKVNRELGKRAAYWGLLAVAVFMLIYYLRAGFIADVALVLNIVLVVGAMSVMSAVLTLPGIAGLILTIGVAVDANVLIFERLREEQAKGQSIRMALKNAYERAFSAIFDANITTLITCLILGWVSTEEVRGFAITLGLGIVFSMFTALVVTRWTFQLMLDTRMLTKPVFMLHIVGAPRINWMSKRHFFWALSIGTMVMGLVALAGQGSDVLGIELSAGTQAVIKLKDNALIDGRLPDDHLIRERFGRYAGRLGHTKLEATAKVVELIDENKVRNFLSDHNLSSGGNITLADWNREKLSSAYFNTLDKDGNKVLSLAELKELPERSYQVSTTETRLKLIRQVAREAFGDALEARPRCDFELAKAGRAGEVGVTVAANGMTRITSKLLERTDPRYLQELRDSHDGVMFIIRDVKPALPRANIAQRIRHMRRQPDFAEQRFNSSAILPLGRAGQAGYSAFAVLTRPANPEDIEDDAAWEGFAEAELSLLTEALHREQAIEVTNFDAQIAGEAKARAVFAILLSCVAIVGYLWLRFGSAQWGLAAVVCLLHDVVIVVGLVALSQWLHGTFIGRLLGISSFKIDLAMIAAVLTVIGYSVNDTIVVFDRIRENRGKLATVSAKVINASINQTLSRTLLTSGTTFIVVTIMYVWGGPGIHAFSYALLAGILFGTYSSVAVASPLLLGFKKALVARTTGLDATE